MSLYRCSFTQIPNVAENCLQNIVDKNCDSADTWSMLLSNLSRLEHLAERLHGKIKDRMDDLFAAFIQLNYNTANCHLNHLGNLTFAPELPALP